MSVLSTAEGLMTSEETVMYRALYSAQEYMKKLESNLFVSSAEKLKMAEKAVKNINAINELDDHAFENKMDKRDLVKWLSLDIIKVAIATEELEASDLLNFACAATECFSDKNKTTRDNAMSAVTEIIKTKDDLIYFTEGCLSSKEFDAKNHDDQLNYIGGFALFASFIAKRNMFSAFRSECLVISGPKFLHDDRMAVAFPAGQPEKAVAALKWLHVGNMIFNGPDRDSRIDAALQHFYPVYDKFSDNGKITSAQSIDLFLPSDSKENIKAHQFMTTITVA